MQRHCTRERSRSMCEAIATNAASPTRPHSQRLWECALCMREDKIAMNGLLGREMGADGWSELE